MEIVDRQSSLTPVNTIMIYMYKWRWRYEYLERIH